MIVDASVPAGKGKAVVVAHGVHKFYGHSGHRLHVLKGVDLEVYPGEVVALIGPSGSGKSSLLQMIGLLERPTDGSIVINGRDTRQLPDGELTRLRRHSIGFVYQAYRLMRDLNVIENVVLPQRIAGIGVAQAKRRATDLLEMVGLSERLSHYPSQLSGGEQQRVSLARSMANAPSLLLADEPTGNLDSENREKVFALLSGIVREARVSVLVATHDHTLASRMDRTLLIHEGTLRDHRSEGINQGCPSRRNDLTV